MKKISELPACPVETALVLMGDRWKMLIVRDLLERTMRFGELQRSVGHISQKVLTQHLRALEESGLVHREVYAEVPPRVEYSLTELGRTLKPIHDTMTAWGNLYKKEISKA
ncbi:winged helix-turn-helix transcriptional regulator [Lactococcus lactis]